ncbi:putative ring-cleavage extradiol dioxygenase [Acidovorax sp. CF316]|uniref:VOC family protein n=1 Tax=Acidovorax sp. CF316 TaxID=1144317 RepID=UPI00026BC36C|nr:VOC family protein [Acidovorax sp. CF316]EJE51833.1 putative ring-cleavage extradiol dioxygenase [Acidovorax sp. CF316]
MSTPIRPQSFAHVVYRTYQFQRMLDWYVAVFNGEVQYQSPVIAFVTYDHEHHRVALLNLGIIKGEGESGARSPRGQPGMDHVAYGYRDLTELLDKYEELKGKGVMPYWCIHHGITISLYYADPDGNQMEFQADCFDDNDAANAFMDGPQFETNPIGVEFDPEELLAKLRAGAPASDFLPRRVQLPVSDIRGSLMG